MKIKFIEIIYLKILEAYYTILKKILKLNLNKKLNSFIERQLKIRSLSKRKLSNNEQFDKIVLPGDKYNPFKLTILDKYLLRDFIKNAFGALFLFIFIYIITQLINELPYYLKTTIPSTGYLVKMYILRIPYSVTLLSPPAFLFSTIFTLGNLYKNNELVAAVGSGVYLFRFTRPLWVLGMIFSLTLILFTEIIAVPYWDEAQLMNDRLRHRSEERKDQFNLNITGEGNTFYSMNRYFAKEKIMIEPIIIRERYNVNQIESEEFKKYVNKIIQNQSIIPDQSTRREQNSAQTQPENSQTTTNFPRPRMGENVIDPQTLQADKEKFIVHAEQSSRPDIPLYLEFRLDADRIIWDTGKNHWVVENGILRYWDLKKGLISEKVEKVYNWILPSNDTPYHFEKNIKEITRMTIPEGLRLIEKLKRSNKKYYHEVVDLIGYHFAFQMGTFIIIFVGLTMGRFHSRKNIFIKSLMGALGLFLTYYTLFQFGSSLGKQAIINPYFAPWVGNVLFLSYGLFMRTRSKT